MMRRLSVYRVVIVALVCGFGVLSQVAAESDPSSKKPIESLSDDTPIAQISDQVITGAELRQRYVREISPGYDYFVPGQTPPSLLDVADLLIREKAIALAAREQGLLEDPDIAWNLDSTRRSMLINYYVEKAVRPAVQVPEEAIKAQLEKNEKLTREQVIRGLQNQKIRAILAQDIKQLHTTLHVQKNQDNIAVAAVLYQKLLNRPEMDRPKNTPWVLKEQMLNELTSEQQQLPLAEFDGGSLTMIDFLRTIHGVVPVKRPKDLISAKGVEKVVDASLGGVLIETHIRAQGYAKQPEIAQQIRAREDQRLLNLLVSRICKPLSRPTEEAITAKFDQIKGQMEPEHTVKSQVLWCEDQNQAAQVKQALADQDVGTVLAKFELDAGSVRPTNLSESSQGMFWDQIWASEPNDIVGPIRGFYRGEIKWRVIKVLEKKPGKDITMHSRIHDGIYSNLYNQTKDTVLKPFQDQLLKKYDAKIFVSRLLDFDPLKQ